MEIKINHIDRNRLVEVTFSDNNASICTGTLDGCEQEMLVQILQDAIDELQS